MAISTRIAAPVVSTHEVSSANPVAVIRPPSAGISIRDIFARQQDGPPVRAPAWYLEEVRITHSNCGHIAFIVDGKAIYIDWLTRVQPDDRVHQTCFERCLLPFHLGNFDVTLKVLPSMLSTSSCADMRATIQASYRLWTKAEALEHNSYEELMQTLFGGPPSVV